MAAQLYIYGIHSVLHPLQNEPGTIVEIWIKESRRDARLQQIFGLANQHRILVHTCQADELDSLSQGGNHQGVVALQRSIQEYSETELEHSKLQRDSALLLALDGVQDPYNLGACMRTAEAAGVAGIIIPKNRATGLTPTVIKVASGAAGHLPIYRVTNLVRTLQALKDQGYWVMGADACAEQLLYAVEMTAPFLCLVLGGEGKGLRRLTRENCDHLVKIPMVGKVESLNVSVATAICIYEALRQRHAREMV